MKEDAYKSLCVSCFQQKAAYFLCCRCIFCKECIQKWKSNSKTIENSADVICGFCNKQTDPKINSFQDIKQAQSFAFLFAEPETLFERQIDIIKENFYFNKQFQRRQSQKYIQYLQDQISLNQQELSFIYENYPSIKNDVTLRKTNFSLAEEDSRKAPRSCINFKGVQENLNQVQTTNDQYRILQQQNQNSEIHQQNIVDQQHQGGVRKYQKDSQIAIENQQYQQPPQYNNQQYPNNNQIQKIYNNTSSQISNIKSIVPTNQKQSGYSTPLPINNSSNLNKPNNNSQQLAYQDYIQRQQMQLSFKQSGKVNSNTRNDQETRPNINYYEPIHQNSKDLDDQNTHINLINQQTNRIDYNQIRNKTQPLKDNINIALNQAYSSYNQSYKPQQQQNYQINYQDQYFMRQNK